MRSTSWTCSCSSWNISRPESQSSCPGSGPMAKSMTGLGYRLPIGSDREKRKTSWLAHIPIPVPTWKSFLLLFRFGTLPSFSGAAIVQLRFLLLVSVAGARSWNSIVYPWERSHSKAVDSLAHRKDKHISRWTGIDLAFLLVGKVSNECPNSSLAWLLFHSKDIEKENIEQRSWRLAGSHAHMRKAACIEEFKTDRHCNNRRWEVMIKWNPSDCNTAHQMGKLSAQGIGLKDACARTLHSLKVNIKPFSASSHESTHGGTRYWNTSWRRIGILIAIFILWFKHNSPLRLEFFV